MDLTDLPLRLAGRARREVDYEVVGELKEADLALLETERGIQPIDPIKLRDSHHSLARVLARGARPAEAAAITGYSSSRISILQRAPAFQELVEFYREGIEPFVDRRARLQDMGMDQLTAIAEDMEENPDKYSPGFRLDFSKVALDRGGLGPQSSSVTTNVNIDYAARLERGLERAANADKLIEHEEEKS